jgi:hypothetical protein
LLNAAHVYELRGLVQLSEETYDTALRIAENYSQPTLRPFTSHIHIRLATLLPRIPTNTSQIGRYRWQMHTGLRSLLSGNSSSAILNIDNSQPLRFGFATGAYLLYLSAVTAVAADEYDKVSTLELMTMLSSLYKKFCPSLVDGIFADRRTELSLLLPPSASTNKETSSRGEALTDGKDLCVQSTTVFCQLSSPHPQLRIGFISRNFYSHEIGLFSLGLMRLLLELQSAASNSHINETSPPTQLQISLFLINSFDILGGEEDVLWRQLLATANHVEYLPDNIGASVDRLRAKSLDLLLFPDLGKDPLSYFISYARSARVQASLHFGNPLTSGS